MSKKKTNLGSYIYIFSVFFAYLGAYVVRNVLATVSPEVLELGLFDEQSLGNFSSILFVAYGCGQLFNGLLGEKIPTRLMVTVGLFIAAVCTFTFAVTDLLAVRYVAWFLCGWALSMLYGPLVKASALRLSSTFARYAYVSLTLASILGASVIGLIAGFCGNWKTTFFVTAGLLLIPLTCYIVMDTYFEKHPLEEKKAEEAKKHPFELKNFLRCIGKTTVVMILVNMLLGSARNAISFWFPHYLSDCLEFSASASAFLFAMVSVFKAVAPFLSLAIYKRVKENERIVILCACIVASLAFLLLLTGGNKIYRIICFAVALVAVETAGSVIGSVFLLGFGRYGCVSAICGFFDCGAYIAAAVASNAFSKVLTASGAGWNTVIFIWAGLSLLAAVAVSLILKKDRDNPLALKNPPPLVDDTL